jgi:hypothetical protein
MRILAHDRSAAIEAIILRTDGEGLPIEAMSLVRQHARRAAADWRTDPRAAVDIEAHLERNAFDQIDIDAQVIAQARVLFEMFDHLMQSAQSRRVVLLREICIRREFATRSRNCENVRLRSPVLSFERTPRFSYRRTLPSRSAHHDQQTRQMIASDPVIHSSILAGWGRPRSSPALRLKHREL